MTSSFVAKSWTIAFVALFACACLEIVAIVRFAHLRNDRASSNSHVEIVETGWKKAREIAERLTPDPEMFDDRKDGETERPRDFREEEEDDRAIMRRPLLVFDIDPEDAIRAARICESLESTQAQLDLISQLLPLDDKIAQRGVVGEGGGTERGSEGDICVAECRCSRGGLAGYGRFCGFHHTGCPETKPCDAIDACCMEHDACVGKHGYTDRDCTIALAKCAACVHFSAELGVDVFERSDGSEEPHDARDWSCSESQSDVAGVILSDILYLLPGCFDEAERSALESTVTVRCDEDNDPGAYADRFDSENQRI